MQDDYDLNQAICFSLKKSGYGVWGAAFMEKGLHQSGRHRFLQDFTVNRRCMTSLVLELPSFLPAGNLQNKEAAVSPIEVLGYRPSHNASKTRKAGEGNLLTRLSREQFTKDKKRTFMVLLSLAASLSVYLCVVTMLDSQAARTIVSNFMDSDLTGWNRSIVERIKGVE